MAAQLRYGPSLLYIAAFVWPDFNVSGGGRGLEGELLVLIKGGWVGRLLSGLILNIS